MKKPQAYPPLQPELLAGDEPFVRGGEPLGGCVADFWRWYASDLSDNATRGGFAEYLVALALGGVTRPRESWDSVDLVTDAGLKVEVKSASPWQSWHQAKPSPLSFGIRPMHGWSAQTGEYDGESRRQADVYVFAVVESAEKRELDPLDLDQWRFYVLPSRILDERVPEQKTIALSRLLELGAREVRIEELRGAIEGSVGR